MFSTESQWDRKRQWKVKSESKQPATHGKVPKLGNKSLGNSRVSLMFYRGAYTMDSSWVCYKSPYKIFGMMP